MDQHTAALQTYIRDQLQLGQSPDTILQQLLAVNWPLEQVQQAFTAVQAQMVPTSMQAPDTTTPRPSANGKSKGRIKTGWLLLKTSLRILNGNRYLFRYLFETWAAIILVNIVLFIIVWFGLSFFIHTSDNNPRQLAFEFASYFTIYFLINFFAAALSSNILDIFQGQRKAHGDYLRAARGKAWPIAVYTIIESIVGMLLRYIAENVRFVGWLISWLLGTAWSLGTMFVLPIIMDRDVSGVAAIKQSLRFFKQTWGEAITAKVVVNTPIFLFELLLILLLLPILIVASIMTQSVVFAIVVIILWMIVSITLAIIGSYANSIVNVALYYYAAHGEVPPGFTAEMLNGIFIKRKRRFFKKSANPTT